MATLTVTIPVTVADGGGEVLRGLSKAIKQAAANIPDKTGSGASVVLTIDNAPATGIVSVQVTGGPYPSALYTV